MNSLGLGANRGAKQWFTVVLVVGCLTACERSAASRSPVPTPTAAPPPPSASSIPASSAPPPIEARPVAEPSAEAMAPPAVAESAPLDPCAQALHEARQELLDRGFAPTQETAKWLYVTRDPETQLLALSIQMRQSADGAGSWYAVMISRGAARTSPWKKSVKNVCCDDHAAPEDNIKELSWKRSRGPQSAEVSVGYFGNVQDEEYRKERELFVSVAKQAADRCLDASPPAP